MEEKYLLTTVTYRDLDFATAEELENFVQENYSKEEQKPFLIWLDSLQEGIMSGDEAVIKKLRMFLSYAADQASLS